MDDHDDSDSVQESSDESDDHPSDQEEDDDVDDDDDDDEDQSDSNDESDEEGSSDDSESGEGSEDESRLSGDDGDYNFVDSDDNEDNIADANNTFDKESEKSKDKKGKAPKPKKPDPKPSGDSDSSSSDENSERTPKCPICLHRLSERQVASPGSGCIHHFCLDCLREWSRNVNTCPIDRSEFDYIIIKAKVGGEEISREKVVKAKNKPQEEEGAPNLQAFEDQTFCEVCGSGDREDALLLCDGCDLGYHLECCVPALERVPRGRWYCSTCEMAGLVSDYIKRERRRASAASAVDSDDDVEHFLPRTIEMERVRRAVWQRRDEEAGPTTSSKPKPRKKRKIKRKTTKKRKSPAAKKRKTTTKKRKTSSATKKPKAKGTKKRKTKRKTKMSKKKQRRKEKREKRKEEREKEKENRDLIGPGLSIYGNVNDLDFYGDEELFVNPVPSTSASVQKPLTQDIKPVQESPNLLADIMACQAVFLKTSSKGGPTEKMKEVYTKPKLPVDEKRAISTSITRSIHAEKIRNEKPKVESSGSGERKDSSGLLKVKSVPKDSSLKSSCLKKSSGESSSSRRIGVRFDDSKTTEKLIPAREERMKANSKIEFKMPDSKTFSSFKIPLKRKSTGDNSSKIQIRENPPTKKCKTDFSDSETSNSSDKMKTDSDITIQKVEPIAGSSTQKEMKSEEVKLDQSNIKLKSDEKIETDEDSHSIQEKTRLLRLAYFEQKSTLSDIDPENYKTNDKSSSQGPSSEYQTKTNEDYSQIKAKIENENNEDDKVPMGFSKSPKSENLSTSRLSEKKSIKVEKESHIKDNNGMKTDVDEKSNEKIKIKEEPNVDHHQKKDKSLNSSSSNHQVNGKSGESSEKNPGRNEHNDKKDIIKRESTSSIHRVHSQSSESIEKLHHKSSRESTSKHHKDEATDNYGDKKEKSSRESTSKHHANGQSGESTEKGHHKNEHNDRRDKHSHRSSSKDHRSDEKHQKASEGKSLGNDQASLNGNKKDATNRLAYEAYLKSQLANGVKLVVPKPFEKVMPKFEPQTQTQTRKSESKSDESQPRSKRLKTESETIQNRTETANHKNTVKPTDNVKTQKSRLDSDGQKNTKVDEKKLSKVDVKVTSSKSDENVNSKNENILEYIASLVKEFLKPHYAKNTIDRETYKMIMKKSVNKISTNTSNNKSLIFKDKVGKLVEAYVEKYEIKK